MGAAVQGEIIAGGTTPTVLIDVTPYTFGTSAMGMMGERDYPYCFVPLIRRNTPIPASHSEVFYTMFDNQKAVDVTVYQGEAPDALDNIEIGRFVVEGLRQVPAGNPIVLDFSIDINGILQVRASEKKSGLAHTITIDNAISRFQDGKLDAARERISAMFADDFGPDEDTDIDDVADDDASSTAQPLAQRRNVVEALALVEKAERLLETANADDREDLIDSVEAVRDAMSAADAGDMAQLPQAMAALADVLYYLEN
jgi:molecular chaperone DnaK (HSP70)